MYKILHIVGNRPHFIKLAPVHRALEDSGKCEQKIIHTGQHYDQMLSSHFIKELNIPEPDHNLTVGSKSPLEQFGEILIKMANLIPEISPDLILVYGDTNSTAAGAIAAAKSNIPLGHVESGLREYSKIIPEEVNKLLTDAVTDLYFCPTSTGVSNLKLEGKEDKVYQTGDVGLDLVFQSSEQIDKAESIIDLYELQKEKYVFMTCHRAANTDDKHNLSQILEAITSLNQQVIFPVHPRTKNAIVKFGLSHFLDYKNITPTDPLGFFETQALIKNASFCLTDSGGVIKEAYFHKTPGIIIDQQTEWIETIDEGWNKITGPIKEEIIALANGIEIPSTHLNSLGDGKASERIVEIIVSFLQSKNKHEF